MVLAQVAHWVHVPAEERPHNLLFLLTTGHMTHGAGPAETARMCASARPRCPVQGHVRSPCGAEHVYSNISGRSCPPNSMILSAGMFKRLAASRIASALGASYRQ